MLGETEACQWVEGWCVGGTYMSSQHELDYDKGDVLLWSTSLDVNSRVSQCQEHDVASVCMKDDRNKTANVFESPSDCQLLGVIVGMPGYESTGGLNPSWGSQ